MSENDKTPLDPFNALLDLIVPTPYHHAALTGNIDIAITAFKDGIPFPTPGLAQQQQLQQQPDRDQNENRIFDSPFSPCDLAMIYPCNYRLLTLFASHGHRPMLSETNHQRMKKWLKKQRVLQLLALYRSTLSALPLSSTSTTTLTTTSESALIPGPENVIETNQKCFNELLQLSRQLNSAYIPSPPHPRHHRKLHPQSDDNGIDDHKSRSNIPQIPQEEEEEESVKVTDDDDNGIELKEIDCEFVEFPSISQDEDCDMDFDDEDSYHYKPTNTGTDDHGSDVAVVAVAGGGDDKCEEHVKSSLDNNLIRDLIQSYTNLDSDDEYYTSSSDSGDEQDNNDDIDDGGKTRLVLDSPPCTHDDNGDELISADQYEALFAELQALTSSTEPQLINLRSLPMPNRTLLLTATTLMNDIYSCNDEYIAQLLGKTITVRCLRLLEDVVHGRFDFGSVNDNDDENSNNDGDNDANRAVQDEIMAIYNLQFNLNDKCGGLFRKWEVVADFENLLSSNAFDNHLLQHQTQKDDSKP